MKYVKEEKDMNLKDLFFDVCAKWRKIVTYSFIGVIIVALINIPGMLEYKDILGMSIVLKELLKYLVIVVLAIVVVMVGIYTLNYIFSDTVKSVVDYNLSTNVKVLGVIANDSKNNMIDRVISKLRGINIYRKDTDSLVKRMSLVIDNEIHARHLADKVKISFVCSKATIEMENFINSFEKYIVKEEYVILCAGEVLIDPEAVKLIDESDFVILIETQNKSKYSQIESCCCQLESWNKEILGTILVNADAI